MILETQIAEVIRIGVSLVLLWALYYWYFRDYRLDAYRQRLFIVRDTLFDDAARGIIPFDHRAYKMMRERINTFIRFGHRVGIIQPLLLYVLYPPIRDYPDSQKRLQKACAGLSEQGQVRIMEAFHQTRVIVFDYVTFGWLFALLPLLFPLLFPLLLCNWIVARCSETFRRWKREFASNAPGMNLIEYEAQLADSHAA